jgi:hypothetical protein
MLVRDPVQTSGSSLSVVDAYQELVAVEYAVYLVEDVFPPLSAHPSRSSEQVL